MDLNKQINLEHLLFVERKCRSCKEIKDLLENFYLTRKDRGYFPSSYSYECKDCTVKRIISSRLQHNAPNKWEYPDW
jgi:hypothetical protein